MATSVDLIFTLICIFLLIPRSENKNEDLPSGGNNFDIAACTSAGGTFNWI